MDETGSKYEQSFAFQYRLAIGACGRWFLQGLVFRAVGRVVAIKTDL